MSDSIETDIMRTFHLFPPLPCDAVSFLLSHVRVYRVNPIIIPLSPVFFTLYSFPMSIRVTRLGILLSLFSFLLIHHSAYSP